MKPRLLDDALLTHLAREHGTPTTPNNSQPLPAEVLVEGGSPRLARPRQELRELLAAELSSDTPAPPNP